MVTHSTPYFIFPLVIGAFTAVSYVLLVVVYTVQPAPFIDEIYHVPQAQKYCEGKFLEWDPKITTLPGLYLFSVGLNGPVSWLVGRRLCDVFSLRMTNLVAAALLLSTVHRLLVHFHGSKVDSWKLILSSLNLSLLPVLYWFTFLYYTDVVSTLVVLLMILLHFHKAPNSAAAMGVVAVMVRQTNIVWVAFVCILMAAEVLGAKVLKAPLNAFADVKALFKKLRKMSAKPHRLAEVVVEVGVECLGYVAVLCGFVAFVAWNGGVAVGDRTAHEATLHLPQLLYFSLFYLAFSLPYAPAQARPFLRLVRRRPALSAAVAVAAALAVHSNTLAHPYLLADNRHLTFYAWRVYSAFPPLRYLAVGPALLGAYVALAPARCPAFRLALGACAAASLVPQGLLEPRYFLVPFLVARTQAVAQDWWLLWIETLYYALVNALVVYLFVSRTFLWEDSGQPQRIIW